MIPALSQVCSLSSPLAQDFADYAAGACRAIELWLGKLESYLDGHSLDDFRRLRDEHGVITPVASYQGGLFTADVEPRLQHWQHFARRLELCRALEIATLVVAADLSGSIDQRTIDQARATLIQAATQAAEHGIRLAVEFQARAALANNLQTAAALIDECAMANLGLCLDAFHFCTGPSKTEDLVYLSPQNLFHVQLCDLSGVPRELASDADRILPGDGDLPLEPIVAHLREMDYTGCVSVELMNPQIWPIPPRQFGEIAITALRKVLGLASMG
jgi:4-hydroxyphenylpyruvate dioxygenase